MEQDPNKEDVEVVDVVEGEPKTPIAGPVDPGAAEKPASPANAEPPSAPAMQGMGENTRQKSSAYTKGSLLFAGQFEPDRPIQNAASRLVKEGLSREEYEKQMELWFDENLLVNVDPESVSRSQGKDYLDRSKKDTLNSLLLFYDGYNDAKRRAHPANNGLGSWQDYAQDGLLNITEQQFQSQAGIPTDQDLFGRTQALLNTYQELGPFQFFKNKEQERQTQQAGQGGAPIPGINANQAMVPNAASPVPGAPMPGQGEEAFFQMPDTMEQRVANMQQGDTPEAMAGSVTDAQTPSVDAQQQPVSQQEQVDALRAKQAQQAARKKSLDAIYGNNTALQRDIANYEQRVVEDPTKTALELKELQAQTLSSYKQAMQAVVNIGEAIENAKTPEERKALLAQYDRPMREAAGIAREAGAGLDKLQYLHGKLNERLRNRSVTEVMGLDIDPNSVLGEIANFALTPGYQFADGFLDGANNIYDYFAKTDEEIVAEAQTSYQADPLLNTLTRANDPNADSGWRDALPSLNPRSGRIGYLDQATQALGGSLPTVFAATVAAAGAGVATGGLGAVPAAIAVFAAGAAAGTVPSYAQVHTQTLQDGAAYVGQETVVKDENGNDVTIIYTQDDLSDLAGKVGLYTAGLETVGNLIPFAGRGIATVIGKGITRVLPKQLANSAISRAAATPLGKSLSGAAASAVAEVPVELAQTVVETNIKQQDLDTSIQDPDLVQTGIVAALTGGLPGGMTAMAKGGAAGTGKLRDFIGNYSRANNENTPGGAAHQAAAGEFNTESAKNAANFERERQAIMDNEELTPERKDELVREAYARYKANQAPIDATEAVMEDVIPKAAMRSNQPFAQRQVFRTETPFQDIEGYQDTEAFIQAMEEVDVQTEGMRPEARVLGRQMVEEHNMTPEAAAAQARMMDADTQVPKAQNLDALDTGVQEQVVGAWHKTVAEAQEAVKQTALEATKAFRDGATVDDVQMMMSNAMGDFLTVYDAATQKLQQDVDEGVARKRGAFNQAVADARAKVAEIDRMIADETRSQGVRRLLGRGRGFALDKLAAAEAERAGFMVETATSGKRSIYRGIHKMWVSRVGRGFQGFPTLDPFGQPLTEPTAYSQQDPAGTRPADAYNPAKDAENLLRDETVQDIEARKPKTISRDELNAAVPTLGKLLEATDGVGQVPMETLDVNALRATRAEVVSRFVKGKSRRAKKVNELAIQTLKELNALEGKLNVPKARVGKSKQQLREGINQNVKARKLTPQQADAARLILNALPDQVLPDMMFSDGGQSLYNAAQNMVNARNMVELAHELGHWGFLNVLTPDQQVAYMEWANDNLYDSNRRFSVKNALKTPRMKARGGMEGITNPQEYYAEVFADYMLNRAVPEGARMVFAQQSGDTFGAASNAELDAQAGGKTKAKGKAKAKPEGEVTKRDNVLADGFSQLKKWAGKLWKKIFGGELKVPTEIIPFLEPLINRTSIPDTPLILTMPDGTAQDVIVKNDGALVVTKSGEVIAGMKDGKMVGSEAGAKAVMQAMGLQEMAARTRNASQAEIQADFAWGVQYFGGKKQSATPDADTATFGDNAWLWDSNTRKAFVGMMKTYANRGIRSMNDALNALYSDLANLSAERQLVAGSDVLEADGYTADQVAAFGAAMRGVNAARFVTTATDVLQKMGVPPQTIDRAVARMTDAGQIDNGLRDMVNNLMNEDSQQGAVDTLWVLASENVRPEVVFKTADRLEAEGFNRLGRMAFRMGDWTRETLKNPMKDKLNDTAPGRWLLNLGLLVTNKNTRANKYGLVVLSDGQDAATKVKARQWKAYKETINNIGRTLNKALDTFTENMPEVVQVDGRYYINPTKDQKDAGVLIDVDQLVNEYMTGDKAAKDLLRQMAQAPDPAKVDPNTYEAQKAKAEAVNNVMMELDGARQQIDAFTKEVYADMPVNEETMPFVLTLEKNQGSYMVRTYQAFTDEKNWKKWIEKNPEGYMQAITAMKPVFQSVYDGKKRQERLLLTKIQDTKARIRGLENQTGETMRAAKQRLEQEMNGMEPGSPEYIQVQKDINNLTEAIETGRFNDSLQQSFEDTLKKQRQLLDSYQSDLNNLQAELKKGLDGMVREYLMDYEREGEAFNPGFEKGAPARFNRAMMAPRKDRRTKEQIEKDHKELDRLSKRLESADTKLVKAIEAYDEATKDGNFDSDNATELREQAEALLNERETAYDAYASYRDNLPNALPDELRAYLGENTDAFTNITMTLAKTAAIAARAKQQKALLDTCGPKAVDGQWLFAQPPAFAAAKYEQIPNDPLRYGCLAGLYCEARFMSVVEAQLDLGIGSKAIEFVQGLDHHVKMLMVVQKFGGAAANLMSVFDSALVNGGMLGLATKGGKSRMKEVANIILSPSDKGKDLRQVLLKEGIIDTNIVTERARGGLAGALRPTDALGMTPGQMEENLMKEIPGLKRDLEARKQRIRDKNPDLSDAEVTKRAREDWQANLTDTLMKSPNKAFDAMKRLFDVGDNISKALKFVHERDIIRRANPTWDDARVNQEAAATTRKTIVTTENLPPAFLALNRLTFVGSFPSWVPASIISYKNNVQLALSRLGSNNPVYKREGLRNILGLGVHAAAYSYGLKSLVSMAGALHGLVTIDDEEEKWALTDEAAPPWSKNGDLVWLKNPKTGATMMVDLGRFQQYDAISQAYRLMGRSIQDKNFDGSEEFADWSYKTLLQPAIEESPLGKTFYQAGRGKDEWGNEQDLDEGLQNLALLFVPAGIKEGEEVIDRMINGPDETSYGDKTLGDALIKMTTGATMYNINPQKSIAKTAYRIDQEVDELRADFKKAEKGFRTNADYYAEVEKLQKDNQKIFERYQKMVDNAFKMGLTVPEIREASKYKIPKAYQRSLQNDNAPESAFLPR